MAEYSTDIANNIENVLLFGVAQRVSAVMQDDGHGPRAVETHTVLLLCVLLTVGDTLIVRRSTTYAGCSQRGLLMQVVSFVFGDTLMREIASSPQTMRYTQSDWSSVLTVGNSTVILIVFACLPHGRPGDTTTRYRSRVKTLLLFMFTQNLEGQLQRIAQRTVLASLALLVYAVVQWQQAALARSRIRQYLARASNMLAVNTMLNLAVQPSFTDETKTGLLVVLLLACDVACSMAAWFAEIRGYALWRAARHVQVLYDGQWPTAIVALAVCILGMTGIHLRRRQPRRGGAEQSIAELAVLVGVNVFVDASTPDLTPEGNGRGLVLLVLYLIAWDVLVGSVV